MSVHKKGRARQPSNPVPQVKLKRLIKLIDRLKDGGVTLEQAQRMLQLSQRSCYRYFQLIEECDLPLEKDFNEKYFLPR